MVRGEELPAQWQSLPLRTQLEMLEGRNTILRNSVEDENGNMPEEWVWILDGEKFLKDRFKDSELRFFAFLNEKKATLGVYRKKETSENMELLFTVREDIRYFPSNLTVTKILMVL